MSESPVVQSVEPSSNPKYYPSEDPNRPICRGYVNQGKCHKRKQCNFYHPKVITPIIKKKAKREPGHCYCNALQRTIINNRSYRLSTDGTGLSQPMFFVVCSSTGKSMRKCM